MAPSGALLYKQNKIKNEFIKTDTSDATFIKDLLSQCKCYEEQIKIKDNTIAELKQTIKTLSKLI